MANYQHTNVRHALNALEEKITAINNSRYRFKRGTILFEDLDFSRYPYVWGCVIDELPLFRFEDFEQTIQASFTIATKLESDPNDPMVNDDVLEELRLDAGDVLLHLQSAKIPKTNDRYPVALRVGLDTAKAIQFHDTDYKIQGIVVNFNFDV